MLPQQRRQGNNPETPKTMSRKIFLLFDFLGQCVTARNANTASYYSKSCTQTTVVYPIILRNEYVITLILTGVGNDRPSKFTQATQRAVGRDMKHFRLTLESILWFWDTVQR